MAEGLPGEVLQNLKDAGCPPETVKAFAESADRRDRLAVLSSYRRGLLEGIHTQEKQLSCLDYLIFQLRNEKTKSN